MVVEILAVGLAKNSNSNNNKNKNQTINLCQAISLKRCRHCLPLVLIGPWSIVGEVGFCSCLTLWISSVLQIIFHNFSTWKRSIWLAHLALAFSHLPILTHMHPLLDIAYNKQWRSTPFYLFLYQEKKTGCSTESLQMYSLSWGFYCCDHGYDGDQKQLVEERVVFSLPFLGPTPALTDRRQTDIKAGTQTRQKPESRNWGRSHKVVLHTSFLPMAC